MEVFLQQLINGITLGSIYGLIAIGYTMVFGIIGMVNFAHGDVFMVSAFIALVAYLDSGDRARHHVDRADTLHRIDRCDAVHIDGELDNRAARLPAAARFVSVGAADLRHRHVDLPVEFRAGDAGTA